MSFCSTLKIFKEWQAPVFSPICRQRKNGAAEIGRGMHFTFKVEPDSVFKNLWSSAGRAKRLWGARSSRVLVSASRRNELFARHS